MEMSDLGETRPGAVTTNGGRRSGDHKSEQLREPDGAGWVVGVHGLARRFWIVQGGGGGFVTAHARVAFR